jgi:DNA modification methylase
MLSSTNAGDLVLDPFFSTSTTGGRQQLGRVFIGIEREESIPPRPGPHRCHRQLPAEA